MTDFRRIRYFLAVADERSFMRAAARLHVSQPPLSVQIKALEEELGLRLFERTNRGVALTAAGEVYYERVRLVMDQLEQAKAAARRAARGEAGSLSVGFVSIADFSLLPSALKRFRDAWPGVELRLTEETTDVQVRDLKAERLDVGIGLAPQDDPALLFTHLLDESLVLALPEDLPGKLPAARLARPSLARFGDLPFVLFPRAMAPGLFDAVQGYCAAAGFAPRILQYARQMQTIVSIVSTGIGISLVPASLKQLKRPGVIYRVPREPSPRVGLGLMQRAGDSSPLVANFRRVAVAAARSRPAAAQSRR